MSTITGQPGIYIRETSSSTQTNIGASNPATIAQSSGVGQTDQDVNIPSNSNGGTATGGSSSYPTLNNKVRQFFLNSDGSSSLGRKSLDVVALEEKASDTGTYVGALIMTVPIVPVVATAISAIAFVAQWPNGVMLPGWLSPFIGTPLLLGTLLTLIAWLLFAAIYRRFTAVDRANMHSFGMLMNRLTRLDAQLSILSPGTQLQTAPGDKTESDETTAPAPPMQQGARDILLLPAASLGIAYKEAQDSCNTICNMLKKKDLSWVTSSGYIELWNEMYSAEEALIEVMPREEVIADALYDELRIMDSKIDTSDELLRKLRLAVTSLDPSAEAYLKQPPPANVLQAGSNAPSAKQVPSAEDPTEVEMQARSVLREVRHALNEFRSDRWEAIIRVRNQFIWTMLLTGVTMFALFSFALFAGVTQSTVLSATAFYLVGALVGLFSRMYGESQSTKSIDDYRLAASRLIAMPLYCGLAAVGGVLVTQKFTTLVDIYNPKNILSGLLVAAVFGLTPNLLINALQKQTEQYKTDLKSTAATQGQGAKTT
jgi:hypothetical protein